MIETPQPGAPTTPAAPAQPSRLAQLMTKFRGIRQNQQAYGGRSVSVPPPTPQPVQPPTPAPAPTTPMQTQPLRVPKPPREGTIRPMPRGDDLSAFQPPRILPPTNWRGIAPAGGPPMPTTRPVMQTSKGPVYGTLIDPKERASGGGWSVLKDILRPKANLADLQKEQAALRPQEQAFEQSLKDGTARPKHIANELKFPGYLPGEGQVHAEYNQKIDDHIRSLGYQPGRRPINGGPPYDVEREARHKFDAERNAAVNAYRAAHPEEWAKKQASPEWQQHQKMRQRVEEMKAQRALKKPTTGQKIMTGLSKIPKPLQVAGAIANPVAGIPLAIASNWGSIKKFGSRLGRGFQEVGRGVKKGWGSFKEGLKRFGGGIAGGIANAFRGKRK